jgi:tRNA-specific 2-thiouridylase
MSGGVDSSVAAARLVLAGFDVVGVTLHLWDYEKSGSERGRCCAPEDVHDARRVAERLGIHHYAFDRREGFRQAVVDPFVTGYLNGQTPSPCVVCNREVKLQELLHLADRLEAQRIATGHYAQIRNVNGVPRLVRARDRSKDQSYFLHMLSGQALERLMFPLGDSTKAEVRQQALELDLPGANKGESQELCFVESGHYAAFVAGRAGGRTRPGPVVDETGRRVGSHEGVHQFTIGQRRNLGVQLGRRAYVTGIDAVHATVHLGPRSALFALGATVEHAVLNDDVSLPLQCEVSVRYRGTPVFAEVTSLSNPGGPESQGSLGLRFAKPVPAVSPGQYAVFYAGERVLGGGVIRRAVGCYD